MKQRSAPQTTAARATRQPARRPWRRVTHRDLQGEDVADTWLRSAPLWVRSALAAAGAAAVSAALMVTVVFLGWMTAAYSTGSGAEAIFTGFALWALVHGVPLDAGFGPMILVPWLLTLLPLACCVWGAQWVLSSLPERPNTRLPNLGGLRLDLVIALGAFALGYAFASTLFALLARASAPAPLWPAAVLIPPLIAIVGFGEALRYDAGAQLSSIAPRAAKAVRTRVPLWFGTAVRSGLWAALSLVAMGVLVLLVAVSANWGRITAIFHSLHTGLVGGLIVVLVMLLYLGTATMWVVSWLAGPGFSLGEGSSVTLSAVQPDQLPPVPILGVLPEPGPLPAGLWLLTLVPVAVGALAGHLATRDLAALSARRLKVVSAGTAALVSSLVLILLAVLSSGSLGSGRLASVGIPIGWFMLAVTTELLFGALLTALIGHRVRISRFD